MVVKDLGTRRIADTLKLVVWAGHRRNEIGQDAPYCHGPVDARETADAGVE